MKTTLIGSDQMPGTVSGTGMGARTVLLPLLNPGAANEMLWLAGILASPDTTAPAGSAEVEPRVVVVSVVEVPQDQPLTTGLVLARSYRALLDFLPSEVQIAPGKRVRVDRIVKVARDLASAVNEAATDEGADLLLLHWKGFARHSRKHLYGSTTDAIIRTAPCDVALLRPEGARDTRRSLLPVRGGPTAERALTLALRLARALHLPLSVMHNVPVAEGEAAAEEQEAVSHVERRGEEPYIIFNEHLKSAEQTATVPVERVLTVGGDPVEALLSEVRRSDFVIMGTPSPGGHGRGHGHKHSHGRKAPEVGDESISLRVSREKGPPLLLFHAHEPLDLASYTKRVRARRAHRPWTDMPFEHWFVENTFHGDEFRDPEAFLEAKKRSGLTISIGLLTSNDADHIHSELTGLKRVLQEMHQVADQIAVIDADSPDGTADVARSLGVEVYSASEILPEMGSLHGRGECWWKSLAVLKGDIVVWLDPRAQRFHPSMAMSLAGPLLRVPTLQLVKAYGQTGRLPNGKARARGTGGSSDYAPIDMSWGGFVMPEVASGAPEPGRLRVQALRPDDLASIPTDQLAHLPPRTILQVLAPGLAGLIEPFSRDVAGRRQAMLQQPAFAGENLEIGLLLSVAARCGTRCIAQVELRHAQPAPPPEPGLRYMIDLLQALSRRLADPANRQVAMDTAERLERSIRGNRTRSDTHAGGTVLEVRALGPVERPPMLPIIGQAS